MLLDAKRYAIKYAFFYTAIIAFILFVPLFVYTSLVLDINEAKNKKELQRVGLKIISKMEEYNNEGTFVYPRFSLYTSGLYDENFRPIFTLLHFTPKSFKPGYHIDGKKRYVIIQLPRDRYFHASYLIVAKEFDPWQIYRASIGIGIGIIAILLLFSYVVLKNFSAPFEKINQALDNFIKDSMHEINTPLAIISVNVDMITRKMGENKHLHRIKAAAKTLANIYNDMDYLIKKDKIEYKKERIDFSSFLQERVEYFQEIANLRNITIKVVIEPDIFVYMNRVKLQRVVDNTLSNAIKYSKEKGHIKVYLKKFNDKAILAIKDYGIGIENPQKIFDRYYREDIDKGGFGIGLNIVKNIIDEEKITLKVVSKPAKGAAFIYYFKIAA